MLDVCLLGTGGMVPLPGRFLTSCFVRYKGAALLIDCGESTQVSMRMTGWSFKDIDDIFFTHYHGDHISGLPGLLLTIGNSDRTKPLTLHGPQGLKRIVDGLLLIAPELPFEVICDEIPQSKTGETIQCGEFFVTPFKALHGVTCYGYNVEVKRLPKFMPEQAKANAVPLCCWNRLQHGETVEYEGMTYTPDMVLGPERKGLKLSYCTDSRPKISIADAVREADLFICEGMYGGPDSVEKAREHKHMCYREAATLAKDACVAELWLTHYSPSVPYPQEFLQDATDIFENTIAAKDRTYKILKFEDEEIE